MTRFARVVRRPVALWTAAALVLGTCIAFSALGRGTPAVAFQQAGHWVYNSTLGKVFRVDGGGKTVDAEVAGIQAEPGSPVLQGGSNGYVVGKDEVIAFGKSDLTVRSSTPIGIREEPLGIETAGGPYLVYRQHGQIVRLGESQQTVTVGDVVQNAVATPDGALWVRTSERFCELAPGSAELECAHPAPGGDAGALLTVDGEPAFANLAKRTLTRLTGDSAGQAVPLEVKGALPDTAEVAQADVDGRIAILAGDRLLLVDAAGTKPATTVRLPSREYDTLAATGAAVAVLDSDRGELRTFDADGREVRAHRLEAKAGGREGDEERGLRVTAGQDGRVYIDDSAGAVVTVVDGDGSVSDVLTDGGNRPVSPDAVQPTPDPTDAPRSKPDQDGDKDSDKDRDGDKDQDGDKDKGGSKNDRTTRPGGTDEPERWDPPEARETRPSPPSKPKPPAATAPGAPRSISVTPGQSEATVEWTAAPANGAKITGYRVQFRIGPGTVVVGLPESGSVTVGADRRSVTFDQLVPYGNYIFTVSAINRVGTGPAVDSGVVQMEGYGPFGPYGQVGQ